MAAQGGNDSVPANGDVPRAPAGLPIAGHIPQWRRDPVKLVTEAARCGDVVRLALPGATYLITHPRHVKHVLQDNHQNYCKGWVFDRIKPYWGDSLLTAEGDTWRQQRRRVQPSFKREHTVSFAPIITRRTNERETSTCARMPLSAAFSSVKASARGLMSVATTCSA